MAEVLSALVRMNLAAGAAILLVLALRGPVRRMFGAQIAYTLWVLPLLAAAACLAPARVGEVAEAAVPASGALDVALQAVTTAGEGRGDMLAAIWLIGVALSFAFVGLVQLRFLRQARAGTAGPAIVGFILPRMVVPRDYEARFSPDERQVVRAHERAHIDRQDPRANAAMAVLQGLNWFNPLVHVAAFHLRLDQELACDAAVMDRFPGMRRRYAETLLKTQLSPRALPLGCHWGPDARHPLEERIAMLARAPASLARRATGAGVVLALAVAVGGGAWAVQPARAATSFYVWEKPELWQVEVAGQGASVRICADAAIRAGFSRQAPILQGHSCVPIDTPVVRDGQRTFRCEIRGQPWKVQALTTGDPGRDFTTTLVVTAQDGAASYSQVRRHRRLGACPAGWMNGDQTGRAGVMIANPVSAQRSLARS